MNALPLQHAVARLPILSALLKAPLKAVREPALLRPHLALLTAFWVYVALSNVLYADSMQASLTAMNAGHIYAPWNVRLLQHAILYPALIACVWASARLGWSPLYRVLPLQLMLGIVFSACASPVLWLAEHLSKGPEYTSSAWDMGNLDLYMWLAGATSFFLQYGFGLALITGFAFYQRLRDSERRRAALERALGDAQLAALRMQLSPHTLFNLLHTIRGHIAWDPTSAQAMVVQLGDLLRGLLNAGKREFSPLADEIQFVRLYLGLQQKRFDRLSIEVPEPEGLPRAWVPSLILQPLIENAVVHGLAGHDRPVSIRVEAVARDDQLLLRVSNTVGRTLPKDPKGGSGIGLANVRERLAIQFGERANLRIQGSLQVWAAEIRMPWLRGGLDLARSSTRETEKVGA
jgi:hypothetical protein